MKSCFPGGTEAVIREIERQRSIPHPRDKFVPCKVCGKLGDQYFDAKVLYLDEEDRPVVMVQRTGSACGHTYTDERGEPLPACYLDALMTIVEARIEKLPVEEDAR